MFLLRLRDDVRHAERVFDLNSGAVPKRLPDQYWTKRPNMLLARGLPHGNPLAETRVHMLFERPGEPAEIVAASPPR
ncbi:hypothetical protein WQE_07272 [Paraburkholderia hospita]|uniref:Uncharacterized protein n=1 Tax=Paraburkholderia hospita TaxID=169430 RepID=A0ABN0FSL9_9BURK|nr:hypothetical protein [Paraburkholderia hospita]EIN01811.1 hypothetical protein WQE_07272 [Paraburkholderia hospita]OUL92300.1 hypothetical protein CA602_03585 [Paraburkholderia hospita]